MPKPQSMPASTPSPTINTNLDRMAKVKKVQDLFKQGFKDVLNADNEIDEMMKMCGEL
jgi:hypothetical protein